MINIVTTFSDAGYKEYGKAMIQDFITHWPIDVTLYVVIEGTIPSLIASNVKYVRFADELDEFKNRHRNNMAAHGKMGQVDSANKPIMITANKQRGIGFIWDAVRFSHKVFAVTDIAKMLSGGKLFWLDADIRTFADIPLSFLEDILPDDKFLCYLGRVGKYTEGGFIGYNLDHPGASTFMQKFRMMYTTDSIFNLDGWTDCHAFDNVRLSLNLPAHDIAKEFKMGEGHPFINSVLGQYMDHLKGPRKSSGKSLKTDLVVTRQEPYWKSL